MNVIQMIEYLLILIFLLLNAMGVPLFDYS